MKPPFAPKTAVASAPASQVDVKPMIDKAVAAIPPNLKPIFDKIVLSGMRILFDKSSHEMALAELNKPGPLAQRLSNGMVALMYMLWTQSNKTIPPQLMVPATLVLTLRAFEFLQMSKDPEATKQVLGDAVADAVQGVMDRFKDAPSASQPGAPTAPPAPPAGGGMLDSTGG